MGKRDKSLSRANSNYFDQALTTFSAGCLLNCTAIKSSLALHWLHCFSCWMKIKYSFLIRDIFVRLLFGDVSMVFPRKNLLNRQNVCWCASGISFAQALCCIGGCSNLSFQRIFELEKLNGNKETIRSQSNYFRVWWMRRVPNHLLHVDNSENHKKTVQGSERPKESYSLRLLF